MSVGVQSDPTELSATQNSGLAAGSAQEWPLFWIMRLIDDSSECNFLDNRCEWLIKSCDLPVMSARPNNANDRKAYVREYIRR